MQHVLQGPVFSHLIQYPLNSTLFQTFSFPFSLSFLTSECPLSTNNSCDKLSTHDIPFILHCILIYHSSPSYVIHLTPSLKRVQLKYSPPICYWHHHLHTKNPFIHTFLFLCIRRHFIHNSSFFLLGFLVHFIFRTMFLNEKLYTVLEFQQTLLTTTK